MAASQVACASKKSARGPMERCFKSCTKWRSPAQMSPAAVRASAHTSPSQQPAASPELMVRVVATVRAGTGAVPLVPVADSLKTVDAAQAVTRTLSAKP